MALDNTGLLSSLAVIKCVFAFYLPVLPACLSGKDIVGTMPYMVLSFWTLPVMWAKLLIDYDNTFCSYPVALKTERPSLQMTIQM